MRDRVIALAGLHLERLAVLLAGDANMAIAAVQYSV